MPLYEYACDACGQHFELIRKFSDPPLETCYACGGGPVHKLLSSPAIQFKGTGWYVTDYARKGQSEKSDGAPPASDKKPTQASSSESAASSSTAATSSSSSKSDS